MNDSKKDTVFVCSHGYAYDAFECEMMMSYAGMDALMEREERRHNFEQDTEQEQLLARQHAFGEADCPWPWYADEPSETEQPEIIET